MWLSVLRFSHYWRQRSRSASDEHDLFGDTSALNKFNQPTDRRGSKQKSCVNRGVGWVKLSTHTSYPPPPPSPVPNKPYSL